MIQLTPDEAVHDVARIADLAAHGDFERTLSGQVSKQFYAGVKERFKEEADAENVAWAELLSRTQPPPKLVKTGKLKAAATGDTGDGAVKEVQPRQAQFSIDSNDVPYAGFHMTGTSKMAARAYFEVTDEVLDAIGDTIADAFGKKIG